LDTVIALRRPEDYSPEQGARFEIHFEKLRNRVDAAGALPFEARIENVNAGGQRSIRWACSDLKPPMLKQAAELFSEGMTVREVAALLRISKSEAGRLRIRAAEEGLYAVLFLAGVVPTDSAGPGRCTVYDASIAPGPPAGAKCMGGKSG
jgi:putative DNA primase/helicase